MAEIPPRDPHEANDLPARPEPEVRPVPPQPEIEPGTPAPAETPEPPPDIIPPPGGELPRPSL
jgi:hypothetical protein